ncbi:GH3 auxin-responsive promoter family protein [Candidatus Bathyarchaeota archaeon]|nr:GH3 auxin-responsive promoter family protein [Candidatus Bathyarchaeota archaeon]
MKSKFMKQSKSVIGEKIGITPGCSIESLPLTSYNFYASFFENPKEGDMMYSLDDYVKVYTSGSMGKPKSFLLPKTAMWDNVRKAGLSFLFISTHDGEKITFELGDTMYRNVPGGAYITGFLSDSLSRNSDWWIKQVPDLNLPFHDKVDYFVENYKDIDVASMTVTTLLDEIEPRIKEPLQLKGFVTQDRSAMALREKINEFTGTYPKVAYGSTETLFCGMPSVEHPGCFFFDWRVVYTEFLPEALAINPNEDLLKDTSEIVRSSDVEVRGRYQLIATPMKNDMTRYVTPDIFECVAKGDSVLGTDQPIFRYYARMDRLLVLHNFTRIAEDELLNVLSEAGIPFVDFTARMELHGSREYMVMYLELATPMEVEEVTDRIHEELLRVDKDWRDLTDFMRYKPLKVVLLPRRTFVNYLSKRVGMPRIERINMKDEWFKQLLDQ